MRNNRIPRAIRLKNRIEKMKYKLYECMEPIGGGNPYYWCRCCHRTNVQLNMGEPHHPWCEYHGLEQEIAWYARELDYEVNGRPESSAN